MRGAWGWPLLLFFPPLGLLTENSSPRTRSNEQGGKNVSLMCSGGKRRGSYDGVWLT